MNPLTALQLAGAGLAAILDLLKIIQVAQAEKRDLTHEEIRHVAEPTTALHEGFAAFLRGATTGDA